MARIRTVKPEFWQHPKVCRVSRDSRLLFLGLLNEADDEGRLRYSAKRLAGVLFAEDEDVDGPWVDIHVAELGTAGLVCLYSVGDDVVLEVCGFTEHQKINRPTPSRLPPAPLTDPSVRGHAVLTEPSLGEQGTGKGMDIAPATRPRDEIWDAVIAEWRINVDELPKTERDRLNAGCKQLRDIGADPAQVRVRRAEFQRKWPNVTATLMAVVGRWAECAPKPDDVLQPAYREWIPGTA